MSATGGVIGRPNKMRRHAARPRPESGGGSALGVGVQRAAHPVNRSTSATCGDSNDHATAGFQTPGVARQQLAGHVRPRSAATPLLAYPITPFMGQPYTTNPDLAF